MGFGFNSPPSNPQPQNLGGLNLNPSPPFQPQPQPNLGFNMLGNQPVQPQTQPTATLPQNTMGFQPIVNNNPNKILAYDNTHLQIWIDCIKESNENTKLFTTYINKTNNTIT